MNQRVVITGAAGFLGRHLAAMAVAAGDVVTGIGRHAAAGPWQHFVVCDVGDETGLRDAFAAARPDVVVHAAGILRGSAQELLAANAMPVPGLCAALHETMPTARLCLAGSSAEYGAGRTDGGPTTEDWPCAPERAYGVSKLAATRLAFAHAQRTGQTVVVARLANLIGPGMPSHLVVGSLLAQLAACRQRGARYVVRVGDVAVQRDFLDVEDACRGLLLLARGPGPSRVVNLASGTCVSIARVLELLQGVVGAPIEAVPDADALAVPGPAVVRLSTALAAAVGFQPVVSLTESLARLWGAATPPAVHR